MKPVHLTLFRQNYSEKQITGTLLVQDEAGDVQFQCKTLELPWKENKRNISCIPEGVYTVGKRFSQKYGWHFHVKDVPGRSYILIHPGNYHFQIRGCILVGDNLIDINGDGSKDVTNSQNTVDHLLSMMPSEFKMTVSKLP